jgi:4-hydroxy-tetrahydrodipicolinate synthase
MALSRVITTVPIFFDDNNMIDYDTLGEHINHITNAGITQIVILDTPEAHVLTAVERLEYAQYVYNNFHNYVQIIVKLNDMNTDVNLLSPCANYLMVNVPTQAYYLQEGLYQYLITLFNTINLPIILSCGDNLAPATIQRLTYNNNLVGIKDTSDNLFHFMKIIEMTPNLKVFTSNDNFVIPFTSVGGDGVISMASNVIPEQMLQIVNYQLQGMTNDAQNTFAIIRPIINSITGVHGHDCVSLKYVLSRERNNITISNVRLPFIQLTEEMQNQYNNMNVEIV